MSVEPAASPAPFMGIADAELDASERTLQAGATGAMHSWDLVTGAGRPRHPHDAVPGRVRHALPVLPQPGHVAACATACRRTVEQVMDRVARYEKVMKVTGGGLTISGGEPLLQARFVANVVPARARRTSASTPRSTRPGCSARA